MAVKRRVNWISQQRVDVPDMRAIESAMSNDFDELIKAFVTGTSQGYVLRGFEISMAGAIGGAANGLSLIVDPGAIFHVTSSQSGTSLLVAPGTPPQQLNSATNTIVDGAFAPSALNYVGIEYERFIDDTTTSQVYLWNPTTNNETTKNAPRAQILRYRVKITTSTFASNVLPIAVVTTDAGNNVVTITDARWQLTRLGQGGTSPNPFYKYPWSAHAEGRTENPSTSSSNSVNPFRGGDKMLGSLKDWMDAVMTSIQEIKGTTFWYGASSSGSLESLRQDLGNTIVTGRGHIKHQNSPAGRLNWDQDIYVRVIGSRLSYRILANAASSDITLSDDRVAYLTLVRGVEVLPNLIFTNGSATVTSVGAIAWTSPLQAGDWIKLGADTDAGYYQILTVDSLTQVTLTENFGGTSTGASGAKAKYAFGVYQTAAVPTTDRHVKVSLRKDVPAGENIWWFAARSDNGGGTARIYVRFLGHELQQGEEVEISDSISESIIAYIGATSEVDGSPQYSSNNVVTDGTSLTTAIGDLDAAVGIAGAGANQDRSLKLVGGGTWAWNSGTGELTLTADAYIQIPGLTNVRNTIQFSVQSPITLAADGDVAHVTVVRSAGAATNLVVTVAQVDTVVPGPNTVVIARRVGSDVIVGTASFRLINGQSKELDAGLSIQNRTLLGTGVTESTSSPSYSTRSGGAPQRTILDSQGILEALASSDIELDKFFGQLLVTEHETDANKARIRASDKTMLDSTVLSQELNELFVKFDGAVINFTTGVITESDGTTPLGLNFTPFSIPANQYFWYAIAGIAGSVTADNRQLLQIQVTPATSANAVAANAAFPAIAGDKKLGAVQIFNNAGSLEVFSVKRLGVGSGSGSGTGNADDIIETIKNRILDSPFELVTPNVFRTDKDDLVDPSSTGAYSPATKTFLFSSAAQELVTTQLLDANEFLNNTDSLSQVELLMFWDIDAVDTAAIYEVSRNGGNEWQVVSMERVGNTDLYRGIHTFEEEAVDQVLSFNATLNSTSVLNATTQQSLAQPVVLAEKSLLREVILQLNKIGTPSGNLTVSIAEDNAGNPGTILCQSSFVPMSSIGAGDSGHTVEIPEIYVTAGTYHILVQTDAAYKASFSAGVHQLAWRTDSAGATPYLRANNGTVWSALTNVKAGYSLRGIELDLRIMVTSSAGTKRLKGYGILYDSVAPQGGFATGFAQINKFVFQAVAQNLNEFTLNFIPDSDIVKVYLLGTGQVFRYGDFQVDGQKIIFPANTFNNGGIEITQTLVIEQVEGNSFDNSDKNGSLLAANHLGSTDPGIDKSSPGRGFILQRPDGTKREISIDNNDNIVISSV